jgi:hypothetical protein
MDPQIVYRLGVALQKLEKAYPTLGKPDVAPLEREEVVGEGSVSPMLRFSDLLDDTGRRLLDVVGVLHCCLTSEVVDAFSMFLSYIYSIDIILKTASPTPSRILHSGENEPERNAPAQVSRITR